MRWNEIFSSVDAHVAGQALRLITFGVPRLKDGSVRQQYGEMQEKYDHIRSWLLSEPRGYSGMTGAVLLPAPEASVDYGVIFMSSAGYSPISGHGLIALATALIETGAVPIDGPDTRITFDTFVGQVQARASIDQGRVRGVRFRNVPAFRLARDLPVEVDGQTLLVDIAYGGNWYVIVKAEDLGVSLEAAHSAELAHRGMAVLRAVGSDPAIVHPQDPDLAGLYGVVILGSPKSEDSTSRNATVYLGGLVDRSPCATGMAATMACLSADGSLVVGDTFISESILDTTMSARIVVGTPVGQYPGIVVEISGHGAVTGMHQFFVDPTDTQSSSFIQPR